MKFKERLIPEIVVEIDGNEIPLSQINEFLDVILENNAVRFDSWEKILSEVLVKLDVIYIEGNTGSYQFEERVFRKSDKFEEFQANFYDLYNKMDRKQLSRERKLKELTDESI